MKQNRFDNYMFLQERLKEKSTRIPFQLAKKPFVFYYWNFSNDDS